MKLIRGWQVHCVEEVREKKKKKEDEEEQQQQQWITEKKTKLKWRMNDWINEWYSSDSGKVIQGKSSWLNDINKE